MSKTLPNALPLTLDLPTITTLTADQPPVLVLDDHRTVRVADLPAPLFVPKTAQGFGILLTNWRSADAPVYLVPDSLVPALLRATHQ